MFLSTAEKHRRKQLNTTMGNNDSKSLQKQKKNPLLNEDLFITNPESLAQFNHSDQASAQQRIKNHLLSLLSTDDSVDSSLRLDRALLNDLSDLLSLISTGEENGANGKHRGSNITDLALNSNFLTQLPFSIVQKANNSDEDSYPKLQLFNIPVEKLFMVPQNITSLNLSHNKLNSIDGAVISQFSNLTELNLYWNQLMEIPEEVFSLNKLQVLNIGRNKLPTLSSSVSKLSELVELNVSFNMISEYPDLSNLSKLKVFTAYRYPGSTQSNIMLPQMNGLHSLKKLVWKCHSTNDISTWSDSDDSSKNSLEELDLSYNALTTVPEDCFSKMSNVVVLHLCHCSLAELPESFSNLLSLRNLYLRGNNFTDVPSVVTSLTELKELDLSLNKISKLGAGVGQLVHVEKLGLEINKLESLSPELLQLKKLQLLRINKSCLDTDSLTVLEGVLQTISDNVLTIHTTTMSNDRAITVLDRVKGCLFGQLIGDAMGLGTEFMEKPEALVHYGIESLKPENFFANAHLARWVTGDYTDDSDQMLLIMDSIMNKQGPDYKDFANRLFYWIYRGYDVLGDNGGLGLGKTVKTVVTHSYFLKQDPHLASKDVWERSQKQLAANGAIMRTCILGILHYNDLEQVVEQTVQYAKVTHYDPRCIVSCLAVTLFIALLLQDNPQDLNMDTIEQYIQRSYDLVVAMYLRNEKYTAEYEDQELIAKTETEFNSTLFSFKNFEELDLDEPNSIGYTFKSMGSAFVSLRQRGTIESILTDLVIEAGDADSNACVAGALLGCVYGFDKLPTHWIDSMPHKEWVTNKIASFIGAFVPSAN